MTEQDQIKALAELDGWTDISQIADFPHTGTMPDGTFGKLLPDYLNSRDAIVPLIEKACDSFDKQDSFMSNLMDSVIEGSSTGDKIWLAVTASPQQLSEALLLATSKWK